MIHRNVHKFSSLNLKKNNLKICGLRIVSFCVSILYSRCMCIHVSTVDICITWHDVTMTSHREKLGHMVRKHFFHLEPYFKAVNNFILPQGVPHRGPHQIIHAILSTRWCSAFSFFIGENSYLRVTYKRPIIRTSIFLACVGVFLLLLLRRQQSWFMLERGQIGTCPHYFC